MGNCDEAEEEVTCACLLSVFCSLDKFFACSTFEKSSQKRRIIDVKYYILIKCSGFCAAPNNRRRADHNVMSIEWIDKVDPRSGPSLRTMDFNKRLYFYYKKASNMKLPGRFMNIVSQVVQATIYGCIIMINRTATEGSLSFVVNTLPTHFTDSKDLRSRRQGLPRDLRKQ